MPRDFQVPAPQRRVRLRAFLELRPHSIVEVLAGALAVELEFLQVDQVRLDSGAS